MPGHVSAEDAAEPVDRGTTASVRRLRPQPPAGVRTTGRVRHDEKITVYVSQDELVALEQARLMLRAEHGIAVDRGRLVREAIAEMLADLEQHGSESMVVTRLSEA